MKEDLLSGESRRDMESLSSRPLPRLGDSPFFIPEFFWQDIRGSIRAVLFGVIDRYIKLLSLVEYIHLGKPCSVRSIDNRCPSAARHYPYMDESKKWVTLFYVGFGRE